MKTNSKVSKRIISLVLTVLLVLSMVPMSVFSAFAEEVSELAEGLPELSATIDTGDSITLKDADSNGYYDIGNSDELYAFAVLVNGGNSSLNAELTADIVVNEGIMSAESTDARVWTPIGHADNKYIGTFDGNEHTVSGLYLNDSERNYVGLFGSVGNNGVVKNTGVINSYLNGCNGVGGVVGFSDHSTVTNCYNTGDVFGISGVGGVIGDDYFSTITNCYNTGDVGGNYAGGVIGSGYYDTITNCYNTGAVSGTECTGGVVAYSCKGTITSCYNTGAVCGTNYAGGVVANNDNGTTTNCYNTGVVSGYEYVGGVVGNNRGKITSCYNTGVVSGTIGIGGVAGDDRGTITNCYYLDTAYAGGIYGVDEAGSAEAKTAEQFASGEVAYLLQGTQEEEIWGQTIGTDTAPVIGGDKVYTFNNCIGEVAGYSNTEGETLNHNFENGFCTVCGGFEPATDENNDGVYEIGNAGQLYWFADKVNNDYENFGSANAILTADIVVNEGVMTAESTDARAWTPIGDSTNSYSGKFEGNSKTVSGLYFKNSEVDNVGLFGCINGGTVNNLGVINSYLEGNYYVGGIVAENINGSISKCYNTSEIIGSSSVGGVVGCISGGSITNCYNAGKAAAINLYAGGVVGICKDGTITNCFNASENVMSHYYSGAVIGCFGSGTVTDCYYLKTPYDIGIGYNTADTADSTEAKTLEQFKSGEVAYRLQGTQEEEIWGQTIDTDEFPSLGGDKVYRVVNCIFETVYSNIDKYGQHNIKNGICTVCNAFEPATDENEDGVYEISNAGQLYWFADKVNNDNANFGSADAILTADIVVNEGVMTAESTDARPWTPIGNDSNKYTGTFDGNDHTVSGLYFNSSEAYYVGLFGYIGENGEVKNTGVINSYFNGCDYVGGVAGENYYGTITNCYNTGEVSGDTYVGGVVGYNNYGTIINCYNTGEVSGSYHIGGVAAFNYYGTIANSYNTGVVSGSRTVGGVTCYNYYGTITNCYNTGEVSGTYYIGGVAGENYHGTITNCYNTGNVSGDRYIGGVAGYNFATITNSYNTGFVSGSSYYVGGVAGESNYGTITNCYYLDTAYEGGIGKNDTVEAEDIVGSAEAKTAEQFKSGEVAYLLQGEQEELVWGQTIGTDELPVLGGDKVYYGYASCAEDATAVYTNDKNATDEKPDHNYVNGFCTACDIFEPATLNEDGVYEIANAGQLYWFADKVNNDNANYGSANAILTADIVVNEGVMSAESTDARVWTPIGNYDNRYTGTFDGNNHTVSGLYFNNSEADYIGLFGFVGENGAVNNTGVINSYFNGYYFVGGVVGVNAGAITNCYNTGAVSGEKYVGGVLGENSSGTITNSYNAGSVSGANRVGGVVGYNTSGTTIGNCYNEGSVSGTNYVGGVVGSNIGTIATCYNTGEVSGTNYIGGVVGNIAIGTIENCYNIGEVSGSGRGGVVGYRSNGTITNCYYLDTACTGGIDGSDSAGSAEAKTAEQFANGEVAYLLGDAFGQKIGTDELPSLGGDKVYYGYYSCADDVAEYTNNSNVLAERPDHNFVNGSCTACGVNALFYAERTVDYDGDVSDESKYFMQLEDALRYAEKSTQNITTYYSECATVKILCNYAIDESVTVTVPSNVTLDLNGFELTNNGTINFESIDGFKVSGGNYTGDGTVKIDEYDGIIFENTLYYFGGEYTPGSSDKRDLAQEKDRTYFTAGEGYAVYKNADGAVLNLYNATINSNESAQSGSYTSAIYYSGSDSLTVNFYGENNLYSKAAADVVGINAYFGLVLNGLGENPIININCENATALSNGISGTDITINSGIVNIVIDNSGEYCIGIDGENITVANDAEINITTGDASRRSVGIYANSSIVNEGEINTSFGEADTSAGVMVTGTDKISNKGTMNALVLQRIATDGGLKDDYYTSGDVVVNKGFSPFNEDEYNHAFTVAEGTSLLINEDASFDLSILSAEDISIMGEVIVDGGLSLPDGVSVLDIKDKITSATDGGTVRVGDNSYCFENGKLKCTSEECHLTADDSTNVANCKRKTVCDICGAEYGDIDEFNHAGKRIPEFTFETPYETEDSKECYVELNLICEDCGECVETQSGYAKLTESAEGTDCLNLGYELYEVTFDIDGVEYTGTNKVTVKSDNHVGEFVNGFCTECGGYQPATLNDNGTTDDEWDDYYEISNAGQLYWFAEHAINDQYARAVLTDDIIVNEDLNAENLREWISIGESSSMPYCGSFDGQGHTISGLYAKSELNYIGLFGAIGWGASISNLGIKDSYFEGNYYVGGIVGYNDFSYIKNCYAENVEIVAVGSGAALVGYNYGEVSNSYSTSGIIADTDYGTITNCYYLADVETEDGGKTAEQFASGEVAYLLQAGIVGEEIWDDELGEYVQTEPEHIWGQKIGEDTYPVFGGDKVYQVENCVGELAYSNANENGKHNFVNGFCTLCGGFEPATLNKDGVYEIGNAGQLYWFADKVNNDNANFGSANAILTADIVVNEGTITSESTDARAWTPIGNNSNRYTGTFDGNNKTVSGLYFNNTDTKYVGLFGYIGENGTVKNTGVINSYFNGLWFVGGVVGANYGTITNCYNTGEVSGVYFTGGIVGQNCGTITRSYNTGIIEGFEYIGGVVGSNNGTITNCYNTGEVSGSYEVGGVVGKNSEGIISNCYNTGEVSSANDYIGGVAGANQTGTITNCYYLDTAYEGGIGKNNTVEAEDIVGSAEAKTAEQFASGEVAYLLQGEQTEEIWGQKISTDTYPVFGGDKVYYGYVSCAEDATAVYTNDKNATDEKPDHNFVNGFCTVCGGYEPATLNEDGVYEIGNAGQLYWFAQYVNAGNTSANAILTADIVVNEGVMTAESEGARVWTPIGNFNSKYSGSFDGNNKTVSGLYLNESSKWYVGLFGFVYNGTVKNTGVINSYFCGRSDVGAIVGACNSGEIINCYNESIVVGDSYTGGVAGYNEDSTMTDCYNSGNVSGNYRIAGVVGFNQRSIISNTYNTGVIGTGECVGGIVGESDGGAIESCYNAGEIIGRDTYRVGGIIGQNRDGSVDNCYNIGTVDGTDSMFVGGIAGNNIAGTITNCYYLNTACEGGIDGSDLAGSAEAKTAEQFASGEVAYLLQGEQEELVWGQKIGTDTYPVLGGDKVYAVKDSQGNITGYSNTNESDVSESDKLAGYSLSLGDKIAVNYYMSLTDKTLNDANAKMVFTVPDTGSTYTLEIPVSEAVKSGDYYVFTCEVAAKEMTSEIKAKLVTSESELQLDDYTVQEYAEVILSDTVKYAKEQELVKKMLNYGAEAQLYFDYNTDNLANDTELMTEEEKITELYGFAGAPFTLEGEETGVTYYGTALSLETELAFKHYFIIDESVDIESLEITCNYPVTLKKNGSFYELTISDIPAHKMGESSMVVTIGGITMDYTIYSYGALVQNSGNEELWTVVSALAHFAGEATMYTYK